MANQLTQLHVRRVSFVAKSSVRDPADPTQPRRFFLWKSDERNTMATATNTLSSADRTLLDQLVGVIDKHGSGDERMAAIRSKMHEVSHPEPPEGEDDGEQVEKAEARLAVFRKAEQELKPGDQRGRMQLRELSKSDQLTILRRSNPRGAAEYERSHGMVAA